MKRYEICLGIGGMCLLLCMIAFPAAAQDATGSKPDVEMIFWESVRESNDIEMYRAYVTKYPNGHFAPLAKIKINTLSKVVPRNTAKHIKPVQKGPAPDNRFPLRSTPEIITLKDIRACIKKYNFSDPKYNPSGRFENAFVDNRDGTITDQATGLIWQMHNSEHQLDGDEAKLYTGKLNVQKFAGRSNWRLPTVEELLSLMEHEPQSPQWFHIDPIFHDPHRLMVDRIWSADKIKLLPKRLYGGWVVNFWYGEILPAYWRDGGHAKGHESYVKAVCTP